MPADSPGSKQVNVIESGWLNQQTNSNRRCQCKETEELKQLMLQVNSILDIIQHFEIKMDHQALRLDILKGRLLINK